MGAILSDQPHCCASTAGRGPRFRQTATETLLLGDAQQQSEGDGHVCSKDLRVKRVLTLIQLRPVTKSFNHLWLDARLDAIPTTERPGYGREPLKPVQPPFHLQLALTFFLPTSSIITIITGGASTP